MKQHKDLRQETAEALEKVKNKKDMPDHIKKSISEKQVYINKPIRK